MEQAYQSALPQGLIRYPVDLCAAMTDRLAAIPHPKTRRPQRRLTPEEDRFIANERLLTKIDFRYWGERYCWINAGASGLQRLYPLWESQTIVLDTLGRLQDARVASGHPDGLLVNVLKARQEGISTLGAALVTHRVVTHGHVRTLLASDVPDNSGSEGLFGMYERIVANLPWWLRPTEQFHAKSQHIMFENGSAILVESGKSMKGGLQDKGGTKGQLGRSKTFSVVHLCLAPETLIQVAGGHLKPIVEVTPQDWVITHTGVLAPVKACIRSRRLGELAVSLHMWGTPAPLVVTRDHPVWTPTGFRHAVDLVSGDWVRRSVRPITHSQTTYTTFPRQGGRPSQQRYTAVTKLLDRDLGYFCGLYLAEGTLLYATRKEGSPAVPQSIAKRPMGIVISCDLSEAEAFATRMRAVAVGTVGVHRSNSRTRRLTINDGGLARWLYREFGEKDQKRIPDWAWHAGEAFCAGLLEGYIEGDGHYVPDKNDVVVVSIRAQLLVQARDLIASLGWGWSTITYKPAGLHYGRNCRECWRLHVVGGAGQRLRVALGRTSFPAAPAKHWQYANHQRDIDVELEVVGDAYSPVFYALEVDHPDHTFTTFQCAVSNTEISTWENPEQIDDALMPAVPRSARTLGIMESTAKGRHNWHHEHWLVGVRGKGRWTNVFIPWYALASNQTPAPHDWTPDEATLAHAAQAAEAGPAWLRRPVELSREQLYWYEELRAVFLEKNNLSKFLEEYAADPESCFQHSGRSVFKLDALQYLDRIAKPPIDVWAVNPAKDLREIRTEELARIAAERVAEAAARVALANQPRDAGGR